jgi:hypothetical protein
MEQGPDSVYIGGMGFLRQKFSGRLISAGGLVGLLIVFGLTPAFAQSGPPVMPQFEADAPKVGEQLPDIAIHDDLGNLVNIRELAGENYKVLVLGCLT